MDYTDDICEMLETDISVAWETALAQALQDSLQQWAQAEGEAKKQAQFRTVKILVDDLLPPAVASTLDHGAELRAIVHGALYTGLDLDTLKFRLDDLLA